MSLSKSIGRPPKYPDTSLMHIVVPSELKKFLRDLSRRTGRSMSELVVEALLNYYKDVKIGNVKVRERKRAIDVMRELEMRRIEKELRLREKNVKTLEEARAQGIMHVKVGQMTVIVWDAMALYYGQYGDRVPIASEDNIISTVDVAVLKFTKNKELAERFSAFLTSERGCEIFAKYKYTTKKPE